MKDNNVDIQLDKFDFDTLRLIDETGEFVEYNLREELAVNEDNLLREMLQQPSKYIYWSSILEKLKLFQESKELALETTMARLDGEARDHIKQNNNKPTKDMVEAYIKSQPEYERAMNELNYYNYIVGRVNRIVKAYEQRKDMLQSYGKQVIENKVYGHKAGTEVEKNPFGGN